MKQILIKNGGAFVDIVPSPDCGTGTVLVHVLSSCISVGTELSGIKTTALPLWKRALDQPENVKKVLESVKVLGFKKTKQLVQGQLEAGNVTGYSAAGVVIGVGDDVHGYSVGDFVACAGAQSAHHAEIINVPQNLVVKVPEGLEITSASSVTLGAIALQGIRRANPTLGECFVVVGLGVLGQLCVQILKANGCSVIGIDIEKNRIETALSAGMDLSIDPSENNKEEQVYRLTSGFGADGVIITAATTSDELISSSFRMCRKKGRVVIVGDIGMNLKRADIYSKELDVLISCSYGPGRYDGNYEEKGLDYPIGHVRWTENRNMKAYLQLLKSGKVNLSYLNPRFYKIDDATKAYSDLTNLHERPLLSFLKYSEEIVTPSRIVINDNSKSFDRNKDIIRVAIIGAGGFAKGMHLPNLQSLKNQFQLVAVMSRTGHNALATAKRYGAHIATTDYNEILQNPEIDAVIIATRHSLHCKMAIDALKAGKHVLLEKPLALNDSELQQVITFYNNNNFGTKPTLMVGFNRRFSEYQQLIFNVVSKRSNPMIINYQMNAGYIPLDHWVHGEDGGGRNIGEACHIYDVFTFLTQSKVTKISAQSINPQSCHYSKRDNFTATISFEDGSIANLTYTALGDKQYPKERMEVFVDGKVLILNDYKSIEYFGLKGKNLATSISEKGQKEELIEWGNCIKNNLAWPIPLWQLIQATEISFQVDNLINK